MTSSASVGLLRSLADSLSTAFFPDCCHLCDLPLAGWTRTPVCRACWDSVRPSELHNACALCGAELERAEALGPGGACPACELAPPRYDRVVSFGRYEGGLRRLIHLLKYERMQPLAEPLGDRLAGRAVSGDLVVAAPLHWRRRRERGFNQATLLARRAAQRWGLPFDPKALRRVKPTPPQAGLTRAERQANVLGAFQVRDRRRIEGRRIILIDDVMTTGATLDACARVLKRAGAQTVVAATLARAASERRFSG